MTVRTLILGLIPLLASCTSVTGSEEEVEIKPIPIDSVEVLILESLPVQVKAHIQGTIGDGCSEIESVTQKRSDQTITITILRRRPKDAVCIQIAKLYDETISLDGAFPPGSYVVQVNDFEKTFTID